MCVQGSSGTSVEQLAIPVLAVALSAVPAVVTLISISFCPAYIGLLEFSKYSLAVSSVFLILGVESIQTLTFDCRWGQPLCRTIALSDLPSLYRWWGDQHHGNADACHEGKLVLRYCPLSAAGLISHDPPGLNLYVAATLLLLLGQVILMGVSVYFIGRPTPDINPKCVPRSDAAPLPLQKIVVATSIRISDVNVVCNW